LPIATKARFVVGVEGNETAVAQARYNALQNNILNCDFITANLFKNIDHFDFSNANYDKILIDPPRTGALEILPKIIDWRPKKLVYISCNPNTLARDAGVLIKAGYNLRCAGIMDMFPHTKHFEAMALFE